MINSIYLAVFILSLSLTAFLIPQILYLSIRARLLDIPNERKVHVGSCSRLGGVAFLPSIIMSIGITLYFYTRYDPHLWSVAVTPNFALGMCACMMLYLVGLADDIIGVRYRIKFLFQIAVSTLVVTSGVWIDNLHGILGVGALPLWLGISGTIFLFVFIINAINLIDGIDGLASGLSCVGLLGFSVIFIGIGDVLSALTALATLATLSVFFCFNVFGIAKKRYKIFMGDTGALVVGFILSMLAVKLLQAKDSDAGALYLVTAAYSALIVPCFDVVRVVFFRYRHKKPLFYPDKSHFHHKLLKIGFTHHQALLFIIGLSILFMVFNLAICKYVNINLIIVVNIIVWTGLHIILSHKIAKINAS